MKVLFNCISSVSGGGQAYLKNISSLLAFRFQDEQRHELFFLAHIAQAELLYGVPEKNMIWISGSRPEGLHRIVWERRNLSRILDELSIDVLFTPYQVATHIKSVKNVLMIRNMEPFLFGGFKYSISTWLRNKILANMSADCLSSADRVIGVSQFASDYLSRTNLSSNRIKTIYHGSPLLPQFASTQFDRLVKLGICSDFIFTCGSMLPYRRCEDVIRAFNLCIPYLPDNIFLVIAGTGTDAGYARMISKLINASPRPSRILTLGSVPWVTMVELYQHCKICVIATEIEACPNIALEAMAAGCSIISSNIPPLPEIFDQCAISYEARDVFDLSQKILNLINDKNLREKLSNKAVLRARDFSWSDCVDKTYSALTDW